MSYVVLFIGEKIEGGGFETEAEARAYCRKHDYKNKMYVIFEGTFEDAIDSGEAPMAVYLHGKGFNLVPIEKDVPYTTYRVIKERLPQTPDIAIIINDTQLTIGEHDEIEDEAIARGAKQIWDIYHGRRLIDVRDVENKTIKTYRVGKVIDGGDVLPDYRIAVEDLFEGIVVE